MENRFYLIEATVNMHFGLCLGPSARIARYCQNSGRGVYIERDDSRTSGKSVLGLVALGAEKGSKLRILVEGEDTTAQRIAEGLARAFSSPDSYRLNF